MSNYLSDSENLSNLVTDMPAEEQTAFNSFGHLRAEAAFNGRLFILYRPSGLNPDKTHKAPEVLTTARFVDFKCDSAGGAVAKVVDVTTGQSQVVNHVPTRLFHYPIFVSIPPMCKVRWNARVVDGKTTRTLTYSLLVKARNRSDFFSFGNTYCETPNDFRALFPDFNLALNFE